LSSNFQLSKEEQNFFTRAAIQLQRSYPPQKYDYVFVGRSMSLLYYMMKEKHPESSFPLPASKVKHWDKWFIEYPPKHVVDHLEKFIQQTKKKHILLIDYVDSGRGLGKLKLLLQRQYSEKSFTSLGFADSSKKATENPYEHDLFFIENTQQSLLFAFEKYDKIAPYGQSILEPSPDRYQVKEQPFKFSLKKLIPTRY
jgi:hypothetical protein